MTRIIALALLASLASHASALDWSSADPVAQARLAVPALAVAPRPGGGVCGQFDSYVFTLEWMPAFCEGKAGLPECSALSSGSFVGRNLALHGLWPDRNDDAAHTYGYCGVDANTRSLDKAATWCRMPDLGLSGAVTGRLSTVMSGTQSCLQNHEWYKHGSCSGLAANDYFTQASSLVEKISTTAFGRFITANVGKTVAASDLLAAFESDFGANTRSFVTLSCTTTGGATMLLDVRLHLSNPLLSAADLPSMLLPGTGAGNCPSSFLIDAVK